MRRRRLSNLFQYNPSVSFSQVLRDAFPGPDPFEVLRGAAGLPLSDGFPRRCGRFPCALPRLFSSLASGTARKRASAKDALFPAFAVFCSYPSIQIISFSFSAQNSRRKCSGTLWPPSPPSLPSSAARVCLLKRALCGNCTELFSAEGTGDRIFHSFITQETDKTLYKRYFGTQHTIIHLAYEYPPRTQLPILHTNIYLARFTESSHAV